MTSPFPSIQVYVDRISAAADGKQQLANLARTISRRLDEMEKKENRQARLQESSVSEVFYCGADAINAGGPGGPTSHNCSLWAFAEVQAIDTRLIRLTAQTNVLQQKVAAGTLTEYDKDQARLMNKRIQDYLARKRFIGW